MEQFFLVNILPKKVFEMYSDTWIPQSAHF